MHCRIILWQYVSRFGHDIAWESLLKVLAKCLIRFIDSTSGEFREVLIDIEKVVSGSHRENWLAHVIEECTMGPTVRKEAFSNLDEIIAFRVGWFLLRS